MPTATRRSKARADVCETVRRRGSPALLGAVLLVHLVPISTAGAQPSSAGDAQEAVERARAHMEDGQEFYVQGDFAEAAAAFQRAYEAQPFGAFLFNAGVAYERAEQYDRAADFMARYIERDPNAADVDDVRTRIDRLRTMARQAGQGSGATLPAVGTPGTGEPGTGEPGTGEPGTGTPGTGEPGIGEPGTGEPTPAVPDGPPITSAGAPQAMKSLLAVRTNPSGAQVTLRQGARVVSAGAAPFAHSLDQGDYRLVIEHPDFRTVEETVRVREGKVYVVIVEMSQGQFLGYLRVVSDIPGAQVFVDDHEQGAMGQTPFANAIATGPHRVWIERPGYQTEERTVEVGLGEDVTLRIDLTRLSNGRIRVVANQRDSTVYVDDRLVGTVPFEGDVGAGPHRVRVQHDGMKDWEQTLTIRQGQVTPVRVTLRPAVSRSGAWVTATIGALFIGAGIVVGVLSHNIATDLVDARDAGRLATNDPRIFEGQVLAIAADVALGLGTILGALATYYFLRDPLPDSEAAVLEPRDWAFAPHLDEHGGGGAFTWSF